MTVSASNQPRLGYRPALDGLRALAVVAVFAYHAHLPWARAGFLGVDLFLVLSGYLITALLLAERRREGRIDLRRFWARRARRLLPAVLVLLAATAVAVPILAPDQAHRIRTDLLSALGYVFNWRLVFGEQSYFQSAGRPPILQHLWSLAVEEQFYLLWPLLVFALSRRGLTALCAVLIGATPLLRLLLRVSGLPELAGYEFTIARWDALAFGAVLAILVREEAGRAWLRPRAPWIGGAAVLGLVAVMGVERGFPERALLVQVAGQTLAAALGASLIYFSVVPFRPSPSGAAASLRASLSAPWLRFLGKYSYAIYVLHFPIHILVSRHVAGFVNAVDGPARLLRLALYVPSISALSIVAALISWRVIEKPFLDLKERFAPRETS